MVKGLALMAVVGVVAGLACAFTMQLLGFEGSSAVVGGVAGGVSGALAPAIMRSRREA